MTKLRTIERYTEGKWETIPVEQFKRNDVFRLRDSNGELTDDGEVCVALEDPFMSGNPENPWSIICEKHYIQYGDE